MTPTSPSPSLDIAPSARTGGSWNLRLIAVLIALAWPTQLLAAGGILGANATASVAQSFHTTQVAWFGLTLTLVTTLLTPFAIKLGDLYGRKRVMLVMMALGAGGEALAALAGDFWLVLVGRAIAGFYGPFGALSFAAVRDIFPRRLVKSASGMIGSSVGLVALGTPSSRDGSSTTGATAAPCGSSPPPPPSRSCWSPWWCRRHRGTPSTRDSTGRADWSSAAVSPP